MNAAHIDLETRSTVDLKKAGVDIYARDPSTDVLCAAWAIGDEPVQLWIPGDEPPQRLFDHVKAGRTLVAHNFSFEKSLWEQVLSPRYGWPELKLEQLQCTMAMAYAMSLPGALEKVAPALGIDERKDDKGHRIMLQLCKPRRIEDDGTVVWWEDPEKYEALYEYCKRDVEVERAVHKRMLALSEREQKVWQWDQRVNARGIYVDRPALEGAQALVQKQKKLYNEQMRERTGGAVATCDAVSQLADWLVYKGVPVPNGVSKPEIVEMLEAEDLSGEVRDVLELRQAAGMTSTAKLTSMLNGTGHDGRIRGTMQYHAAGTGRWGGRRIQPQNYPRQKMPEAAIEHCFEIMHEVEKGRMSVDDGLRCIDTFYGPPVKVVSECLRTFLMAAPGNELIGGDLSNIEGRKLAWMAGEEWKLEAFRAADAGTGPEIYKLTAGGILDKAPGDIDDEERQAYGKVPELALGYQGGVGAFRSMAKVYGVDMAANYDTICDAAPGDAEYAAEAYKERGSGDRRDWIASEVVKLGWRRNHPATVQFWYDIEDAACRAVLDPGTVYSAGSPGRQVRYRVAGSFLWCQLPAGRVICYPYPQIQPVKTPWGSTKEALTYMNQDQQTNRWVREKTYGGKLAENVVQASARDVLVDGMGKIEVAGYPIIMHVHDEAVAEVPAGFGDTREVSRLMTQTAPWCEGLPLAMKAWRGLRYTKR